MRVDVLHKLKQVDGNKNVRQSSSPSLLHDNAVHLEGFVQSFYCFVGLEFYSILSDLIS